MKKIAISQRIDKIASYNETRDALDQRWWNLFNICDLTPIIFPNDLSLAYKMLECFALDGVILTGGNQSQERLEVESLLIEFSIMRNIPLLGICHGMQMIQHYFGIPLIKAANHVKELQEILIDGQPEIVNSYHDYGSFEITDEFIVWAKAHDGMIKAIKHSQYPLTGIMWHPERIMPFAKRDIQLIKTIFYGPNV